MLENLISIGPSFFAHGPMSLRMLIFLQSNTTLSIFVLSTPHRLADDSVDVTSEPIEQEMSIAASHNPYKPAQLEVQLGGAVTLQCPQGKIQFYAQFSVVHI